MLDIAIIGAGPAGLATALRLHQQGFRPRLFETVSELKPLGVGVDIKPYAVKEITEMGLYDAFRAISVEAKESVFYTGYGQEIFGEKCGRHMGYEYDQRFVHRGHLQMMLYKAVQERLGAEAITLGTRCTGFEQDADGVTVHFDNSANPAAPATIRADIVIGVDGIRSVVRSKLLPESSRSHFSGITLYRGVTVMPPVREGGTILHIGDPIRQGTLIVYPIQDNVDGQGNQLVNWVIEQGEKPQSEEDWNQEVGVKEIEHVFDDCQLGFLDIGEMIRNARECYLFPLIDHDPLPQWSFGRVTLLGDAAHAMYPRGGNSVCQAFVDARTIAERLATIADPVEALKQYENDRREKVNWLVLASRGEGPEVVRRIVEERSGGKPFDDIEDIFPHEEALAIFSEYHAKAGMKIPTEKDSSQPGKYKSVFAVNQ
ncbi:pyridine nucleotide-disulfide oxidoreductase [Pokkaliibacter plantistimulans]|uniref:Pyridine nucleotide-disulfide oxidoreductase n=1 Tax=Proteobacteria bacterium 228 TaxID=2083153 RepID=A0A2S5KX51_9PROT|nr:FAD-dependent monooxygenase [Pokkaliibacter plantistimulans]PPC79431.1 pyridine nucleotide-disulfide oxidoreductase [Pokkaliibacter plantistimulans]